MKSEAHGTQQPRHINLIGEGVSTAPRLPSCGAATRKMAAINSDATPLFSAAQSRKAVAGGNDWEEF